MASKPPPNKSAPPRNAAAAAAAESTKATEASPLLTIAVSSRALFDFEQENAVFDDKNESAYMRVQRQRLDKAASPGIAFPMVKKLLAFNTPEERLVDVFVISRNDPFTGLRIFNSIDEYQLDIRGGCFTRGSPSLPYLPAFGAHLFLSALDADVRAALESGFPAAKVMGRAEPNIAPDDDTLRIAFDGDAVLFGDESERIYQKQGLKEFQKTERELAHQPLSPGPLAPFFTALHQLHQRFPSRIRTALVTSRGRPAHKRPILTLEKWGLDIDEAFFLGGTPKAKFIEGFHPDFFFDDQIRHLPTAQAGGHVSAGIANEPPT